MSTFFQNSQIKELQSSLNTSYLLDNNSAFLITEYKVLKTKVSTGLIKCSKVLYNGKIKLVYFSNGLKQLSVLWNALDDDACLRIFANLLGTVIELKNNGFLNCHNLILEDERIFVDTKTLSVHLIYLPINNNNWDFGQFSNDIRSRLLKALTSNRIMSHKMINVSNLLANGTLELKELYQQICEMCKGRQYDLETIGIENNEEEIQSGVVMKRIQLISMSQSEPFVLEINKNEFVIGKNPVFADGVISFNKAISRKHCKILNQQGIYYLVDLGSVNGTYLNRMKLVANQKNPIKNGDIIRLANSDFMIRIGGI